MGTKRFGRSFIISFNVVLCTLLLAVFCTAPAFAQNGNLSPALKVLLKRSKAELVAYAHEKEKAMNVTLENGQPVISVLLRASATQQKLEVLGLTEVNFVVNDIYTAKVPLGVMAALAACKDVVWVDADMLNQPVLNVSTAATASPPPYIGANAQVMHSSYDGTGVIVGIVDTGIDWDHGDFVENPDTSNQSRILSIWDQTLIKQGGENPPSGYATGVEYTQSQINSELGGSSVPVRAKDINSHGTHVAGIAAGDGSDSDGSPSSGTYEGMAPGADLIIVKTNMYTTMIIKGVEYIFDRATALGKPAVVNLSLGHQYGPHDGTSVYESSLSGMVATGKIIVCAAGNDRGTNVHAEANIPSASSRTTSFAVPSGVTRITIEIWYDGGDTYNVMVTSPGASTSSVVTPGNSVSENVGGQGLVTIDNTVLSNPNNSDGQVRIEITSSPAVGTWSFTLTRVGTGGDGDFDAWIPEPQPAGTVQFSTDSTDEEIIISPANADDVITVAAHTSKTSWETSTGSFLGYGGGPYTLGEIASFSCIGPTRDTSSDPGNQKPEISAPGFGIASSLSTDWWPYDPNLVVDDSRHRMGQGTSQAAPHVTGAVALLLQKDSTLTPAQIEARLTNYAYTDSQTGSVPNYVWGYGKLNTYGSVNETTLVEHWELY